MFFFHDWRETHPHTPKKVTLLLLPKTHCTSARVIPTHFSLPLNISQSPLWAIIPHLSSPAPLPRLSWRNIAVSYHRNTIMPQRIQPHQPYIHLNYSQFILLDQRRVIAAEPSLPPRQPRPLPASDSARVRFLAKVGCLCRGMYLGYCRHVPPKRGRRKGRNKNK